MQFASQTSKSYIKGLQKVYNIILFIQLLFAAIAVFFSATDGLVYEGQLTGLLLLIIGFLSLAMFLTALIIYFTRIKMARQRPILAEKLTDFRISLYIIFSLLSAPSFLAILAVLFTGNYYFLIVTASVIVVLLLLRPTKKSVAYHLQLSQQNRAFLNNEDAVVI